PLAKSDKFRYNNYLKDIKNISSVNKMCDKKDVYKLIQMVEVDKADNILKDVNLFSEKDNEWLVTFTKNKEMYDLTLNIIDVLEPVFDEMIKELEYKLKS
nr:hypothetical protein [Lachnospiraceae bacterium]